MSAITRQQIWKKAIDTWSGESITQLQKQQHELMLKCVECYGDNAAEKFKQLSEVMNQQLAADLMPNPNA